MFNRAAQLINRASCVLACGVLVITFQNCSEEMPSATLGGASAPTAQAAPAPSSNSASMASASASPDPLNSANGLVSSVQQPLAPVTVSPPELVSDLTTARGLLAAQNGQSLNILFRSQSRDFHYGVRVTFSVDGYQVSVKSGSCSAAFCQESDFVAFPKRTIAMIDADQDVVAVNPVDRRMFGSTQFFQLKRDMDSGLLHFSMPKPLCAVKTSYRTNLFFDGRDVFAGMVQTVPWYILAPAYQTMLGYKVAYVYDERSASIVAGGCGEPFVREGGRSTDINQEH